MNRKPILAMILVAAILNLMALAGAAHGASLRELVISNHYKFIPNGDGPFPTVVAIPGCSGIAFADPKDESDHPDLREDDRLFRRHYLEMGERLRAVGFAVLLIHIQGAEGLLTACSRQISGERIAEYINESVAWARTLEFVDAMRLHLIGWSMGGGGTLEWLHGPRTELQSVRSVVAVYPGCSNRSQLTNKVPLLVLLGGADDIAVPSRCEDLLATSGLGELVEVHRYDGARHGFDIQAAPSILEIADGKSIGYQSAAAEASWEEIMRFLAEHQ
jgi:dienelactone hydrolase